jgi:hypothetical protein
MPSTGVAETTLAQCLSHTRTNTRSVIGLTAAAAIARRAYLAPHTLSARRCATLCGTLFALCSLSLLS